MKTLIQSLLRPFGLRLTRIKPVRPLPGIRDFGTEVFFEVVKRFGFSPKHIVDIGANHGDWTRAALRFFPEAHYTLLEPQDWLKIHIQDLQAAGRNIHWINAGASDISGTLPFYISHRDDASTFATGALPATSVKVWSLDDLLVEYSLPVPELVKIDAEGFDLKVLRGAKTLLGETDVFLAEAAVVPPAENSVAAIITFMAENDYRLIDITDINRSLKHNVLWLTELAFLRNGCRLLSTANSWE